MAKHTVTVEANGMTYKVETDADTFMIGGVKFEFHPSVVQLVTSRARFLGARTNKIACIKAVREASCRRENGDANMAVTNYMSLRDAKELVEACGIFEIFPESKDRFEAICRDFNLTPTYL